METEQIATDEWVAENYPGHRLDDDGPRPVCAELLATVVRLGDEADRLVTALDMAQAVGDALALDMVHLRRMVVSLVTDLLVMDAEQAIDLAQWPAARALVDYLNPSVPVAERVAS